LNKNCVITGLLAELEQVKLHGKPILLFVPILQRREQKIDIS